MPRLKTRFAKPNEHLYLYRPPLAVHFNPQAWNNATLKDMTGPYAYALNLPQIGECKPGHLFTPPVVEDYLSNSARGLPLTPEDLAIKLDADGLYYHDTLPSKGHVLAFFLKPASASMPAEMLYVRRDSCNQWSYREVTEEGGCRRPYLPRQCDFNGKEIKDILSADLGRFTQFLGFASIPYDGIIYYRRLRLGDAESRPFTRAVPAQVTLGLD